MKRFVLMAYAALLLAGCVREEGDIPPKPVTGKEVKVELKWSVAGMTAGDETTRTAAEQSQNNPDTRVIPSDMEPGETYDDGCPTIQNMWIIQFNGNTPTAQMLGAPRFLSVADGDLPSGMTYPTSITVPLVEVTSECYTLFVANIRQGSTYNWNLTSESTFSDVVTRVKSIYDENGAHEDFTALPTGTRTLLMSAVTKTSIEGNTMLEPIFLRNVAKVTLNLELNNDKMKIVSVRMRNVSNKIVFADAALEGNGVTNTSVSPVDAATIDYNPITDPTKMPSNGKTATYSWYVPRNQQGVDTRPESVKEKTFFAPLNATFIEIVAVKEGFGTSIFRVYPGADMINDFNLVSNHEYTVGLNVVDIGTDPSDSRVQTISNLVDYSGAGTPAARSNSFIINPAPTASGATRTYLVGVHQANRFWGSSRATVDSPGQFVINEGERWVANLIWCDLPGLFDPTATSTTAITLTNNNGLGVGVGEGPNQAFALNVPPNLPAGNFVIGIKKADGDDRYLWSWHFWVTDYDPDSFNRSLIDHNTYAYAVPGGQVERLAPGKGTNYNTLWEPDGLYADRVMMDRNMGATENFFSSNFTLTSRGMIHYQFGRKDPIPGNVTLVTDPVSPAFTPATSSPFIPVASTQVKIAESVANPWVFYGTGSVNWAKETNNNLNGLWHDPECTDFNAYKSIYDPCPPGWRMPIAGTWNDMLLAAGAEPITVLNLARDLGWTIGRGIGTTDVPVRGLRYWPGTAPDDPVSGVIWYPPMASRHSTTGALNGNGLGYWSASPASHNDQAPFLGDGNTSVTIRGNGVRGSGMTVRCITDNRYQ